MKILIGSKNPVKVESVKEAFSKFYDDFEVISVSVSSDVPDQPFDMETYEGAKNRALNLKKVNEEKSLGADFFVGIEGGIINLLSRNFSASIFCIADKEGRLSFSSSNNYELPSQVIEEIKKGKELGQVMDELSGIDNSKHKGGAVEFFTNSVLNRKDLYVQGMIAAMIPFINKSIYFKE